MEDNSFLKFFITEPVYHIQGEEIIQNKVEEPEMKISKPESEPEIIEEAPKEEIKEEINQPISIKGSNAKNVIIIVNEPEVEFISDSNEDFLGKILKAVKLDIKEVGLINAANNPGLNQHNSMDLEGSKFLLFGIESAKIFKDNFPHYQIIELESKQFLSGNSLSEIAKDSELKKLLWTALQKLFL
ncbi:hypothetical protein [Fulvivirga ligni]|uniref:hypothetical protein n=1 Tax=Fulvivirga ligni TaxID=2904246 RepID=UPI001F1BC025|nr:hypothetical protein [Fulvivirga ligni]UII20962.1 hypothetical protein LVD16_24260 [Fulvivirga ligni]